MGLSASRLAAVVKRLLLRMPDSSSASILEEWPVELLHRQRSHHLDSQAAAEALFLCCELLLLQHVEQQVWLPYPLRLFQPPFCELFPLAS